MSIINLSDHRPHISGEAKCMECMHEWAAIAPIGTSWLECPSCRLTKGVMKYPAIRSEHLHYECNCGNDLFYRTDKGDYCPKCGAWCD